MAQGTVTMFQKTLETIGLGEFNLNTDEYRIGLIKSAANGGDDPATGDADPGWHASRTTNFLAAEVTPGGNYSTGGIDMTNTYSQTSGVGKFDGADHTILVGLAGNPTNVRWGILYNWTDTDKKAVAYIDMGSDFDATTGDIIVTWNASGIIALTLS